MTYQILDHSFCRWHIAYFSVWGKYFDRIIHFFGSGPAVCIIQPDDICKHFNDKIHIGEADMLAQFGKISKDP